MTKAGGGDRGDAARAVLDHLLSKPSNVKKLNTKYQKAFDEDPVAVVERLLKLVPKTAPKKEEDDKPPLVGVNIILTTEKAKRKRKK